jgi:hypothetical protein
VKLRSAVVGAALVLLAAAVAVAGPTKVYEFVDAGIRFSWGKGIKISQRSAGSDVLFEGQRGSVELKVIFRKGERLGESTHQFRLMSYFAGEWTNSGEFCRGKGWEGCSSWKFDAEGGKRRGFGEAGHGPGGTYLIVLTAPTAKYTDARLSMRLLQESIELF